MCARTPPGAEGEHLRLGVPWPPAVGRDYDDIEMASTILDIDRDMSRAQMVDKISRLAAPGIQPVVLANWGRQDVATLDRIARDVLPRVSGL
ncbi:MAG TPA: hypothetical protein VF937_05470 [Chloroflexota bacterium]